MKHPSDLERQARDRRDLAVRARKMARMVSEDHDRERIERFANALEEQADKLDAEASAARSTEASATHVVRQQQQAHRHRG